MLYLLFILLLVAIIFAVVWLGARAKEAATDDPNTMSEPENPPPPRSEP